MVAAAEHYAIMTDMIDNTPLVSIITPCYNVAPFIAETIRSVIAQTYSNWELILIDDGSKDNIAEVVQPFLEDKRIQFHVQKNQGVGVARNNGIALAKSDFIAFLDSDDMLVPEALHRQLEVFQKYPDVGVCGCGYIRIDAEGQPTGNKTSDGHDFHGWATALFLSCTLSIPVTAAVVRKSICEQLKSKHGYIFDESLRSLAEDFDFWLRCSTLAPFYRISDPLFLYRAWDDSASSIITLERQDAIINEIVPRFYDIHGGSEHVQWRHIRQMQSFLYHERGGHLKTTTWLAKTYWFVRSLLCNPWNRDAWGALGHQLLPKPIYRWIVKWFKR